MHNSSPSAATKVTSGSLPSTSAVGPSEAEPSRAQMERDANCFRAMRDHAPLGICEFDHDGKMIYWNQFFLNLAGIKEGQPVLKTWLKQIHPDDLPPLMKDWPKNVLVPHDYRVTTPHRGERWIRALVIPTQWDAESNPKSYLAMVADVTDQKLKEMSLELSNQQLEAHVAQRDEELSAAVERLSHESAGRRQAEQERQSFVSLVENSSDFIALADLEGNLQFLNAAGRGMIGLDLTEDLSEIKLADCSINTDQVGEDLEIVRQSGRWTGEGQPLNRRTGRSIEVLTNAFLIGDPDSGAAARMAIVKRDISELKRINESVRVSEERFRQLADNIDEVFWILEVPDTKILYASPAYERIWGHPVEELYADPYAFLNAVHPDDRERTRRSVVEMAGGDFEQEFRVIHPNGTVRTVLCRSIPIRNARGKVYRVGGITQDITERKQAQEELLAERWFLEHLLQLQERERTCIAYDIHDGFVQSVTAAAMHLDGLEGDPDVRPATREKLQIPLGLLRESIEEARRMISGLRPPIIDEQGVVAAIDYLIHESAARGIKILFKHDVHFQRLEGVLEDALFRIVQEALSNVQRHSQAKLAQVTLSEANGRLTLVIEDSGVGFDSNKVTGRQFGLRGIRERAALFGGTATIQSTRGLGTKIIVDLPLVSIPGGGTSDVSAVNDRQAD